MLFIFFALRFYQHLVPGPWQQYVLFIVFALRFLSTLSPLALATICVVYFFCFLRFYQHLVALLTIFFLFYFLRVSWTCNPWQQYLLFIVFVLRFYQLLVPWPWQQYVLFIVFALRLYQHLVPWPWEQYVLFIVFALIFYQLLVALLTIF